MLNPRSFLEDCVSAGYQALWQGGMPWRLVNESIDIKFNYVVSDECKAAWVSRTGRAWDNTDDPMSKTLRCPGCGADHEVPWTTCGMDQDVKEKGSVLISSS